MLVRAVSRLPRGHLDIRGLSQEGHLCRTAFSETHIQSCEKPRFTVNTSAMTDVMKQVDPADARSPEKRNDLIIPLDAAHARTCSHQYVDFSNNNRGYESAHRLRQHAAEDGIRNEWFWR